MTEQPKDLTEHSVQSSAAEQLKYRTQHSQQILSDSTMVQYLLSESLTDRGYFQALEVWVQCWRTLELLEQLHRPQAPSLRNIPKERCISAQADLVALNGQFGYTPLAPGQELPYGAAFPFWSQNSVDWYGLVFAMCVLSQEFKPIGQHLSAHFSQSVSAEHLSFFNSDKPNTNLSGAELKSWNRWLSSCLTTDAAIEASITTATELLYWFNRCLKTAE